MLKYQTVIPMFWDFEFGTAAPEPTAVVFYAFWGYT
jgi:hypothetical protein